MWYVPFKIIAITIDEVWDTIIAISCRLENVVEMEPLDEEDEDRYLEDRERQRDERLQQYVEGIRLLDYIMIALGKVKKMTKFGF